MKCKHYPDRACDGNRCYSCDAKSEAKVDRSHPQSRHLEVGHYTADLTKDGYRLEGNEWLPGPDAGKTDLSYEAAAVAGWDGPDPRGCPPPETGTERRRAILREVEGCVCRDRQNSYGDAEDNFADIALMVSIVLAPKLREGVNLEAEDIAIFNACQKLARIKTSPNHLDNWVDLAGYAVCGGGIIKSRVA